jgi:prevent-host-death family protein
MERIVTASDANREFSSVLGAVRRGYNYVITAHGKPVAKIVPLSTHDAAISGAKAKLLARLKSQRVKNAKGWTRDDLYDD